MRRWAFAAAAVCAWVVAANPASAAIMMATITGAFGPGSVDTTGVFGVPGADLSGETFALTHHYDTSFGSITTSGSGLVFSSPYGDANLYVPDINGHIYGGAPLSLTVTLERNTGVPGISAIGFSARGSGVYGPGTSEDYETWIQTSDPIPSNLDTPFTANESFAGGPNFMDVYEPPRGAFSLTAIPEQIVVQKIFPIPEPATWAMMLLGFFALGGVLRRRAVKRTPARVRTAGLAATLLVGVLAACFGSPAAAGIAYSESGLLDSDAYPDWPIGYLCDWTSCGQYGAFGQGHYTYALTIDPTKVTHIDPSLVIFNWGWWNFNAPGMSPIEELVQSGDPTFHKTAIGYAGSFTVGPAWSDYPSYYGQYGAVGFEVYLSPSGMVPYTFTVTSVPEPAAWAMMLLGIFGAGSLLRRRRDAGPALRKAGAQRGGAPSQVAVL